jgi:hypothetical protein
VVLTFVATRPAHHPASVLIALAPTWIFWGLDSYYLTLERGYRTLFEASARQLGATAAPTSVNVFAMTVENRITGAGLLSTARAPNVAAIPAMLTAVILLCWFLA